MALPCEAPPYVETSLPHLSAEHFELGHLPEGTDALSDSQSLEAGQMAFSLLNLERFLIDPMIPSGRKTL